VGTRESYPAGTFCWIDLATTDVVAAKRFYGDLLGWDAPPGAQYSHWTLDGHDVAGVYTLPEVASAWTSYVAVGDADATAVRAAALGGRVEEWPGDTGGGEGRRAVVADPLGARVALWQARTHPGAELVNDVGCWCLNQLQAPDPAPAIPFYRDLFGWEVVEEQDSEPPYWNVLHGGRDIGGMVGGESGPPAWVVYFHVADVDATARAAADAGGAIHFPPTTVGIGRLAVCADPQGAAFGVFTGPTDP
jgi:uncharacterized protein